MATNTEKEIKLFVNGQEIKCDFPSIDIHMELKPVKVSRIGTQISVYWNDGTITRAKCEPGDSFDEEKGVLIAMLKKFMSTSEIIEYMGKCQQFKPSARKTRPGTFENKETEKEQKKEQTKNKKEQLSQDAVDDIVDKMMADFFNVSEEVMKKINKHVREHDKEQEKTRKAQPMTLLDFLLGL